MGQLEKANLTGASVTDSIIEKSTFLGTQLTDADFDGTTISQSNLSDFDSLQMLLDGGIKLGLDNQLPSLFKEIESIGSWHFYLLNMGKVGRPKKKITHFIDLVFCFFFVSVFVLFLLPTPLAFTAAGFLWLVGEVASAFK